MIIYIVLLFTFLFSLQVNGKDPFAEPESGDKLPVPNIKSLPIAKEYVDSDMLDAFKELPIGSSALSKQRPCFRIFIELNSKYPTLLKWHMPNKDTKMSYVEVKQITRKHDKWIHYNK